MKKTPFNKFVRPIFHAVLIAGMAGMGGAGAAVAEQTCVAKEISLPAPNSPEPSVTVWIPVRAPQRADETPTARNGVAKVIALPAPNGPARSITIWVAGQKARP